MAWINSRSFAEKFINLFADNRAMPTDWKFFIPLHIVQQPLAVVANAKNFADGINEAIELYDVHIPPELHAYNGMEYGQEYLQTIAAMANRYAEEATE
jgi:GR25 family glycosyltransferase involved in LPS biosynthesis